MISMICSIASFKLLNNVKTNSRRCPDMIVEKEMRRGRRKRFGEIFRPQSFRPEDLRAV
jgi:hypothetical protein